jgi:hypothetical protein
MRQVARMMLLSVEDNLTQRGNRNLAVYFFEFDQRLVTRPSQGFE